MTLKKFVVTSLLVTILASCTSSIPTESELANILKEPLLNSVTFNGASLPREAVAMSEVRFSSVDSSTTEGRQTVNASGTALVALTESGGRIQSMLGNSGLEGVMQLQNFGRGQGWALKKGQILQYSFEATLIKNEDNNFIVADGHVSET